MVRTCPHCGVRSKFETESAVNKDWVRNRYRVEGRACIYSCHNCKGLMVVYYEKRQSQPVYDPMMAYPVPTSSVEESVPRDIATGMKSALRCLAINEYLPAWMMFIRTLSLITRDRGAMGSSLNEQLDDLVGRHILTTELSEWARLVAGEKDQDETILKEHVEDLQNFLDSLITHLYIHPARREAARSRREGDTS